MGTRASFSLSERDKMEIDSLAASDKFTSKSDVVKTALRLMKERNPEYKIDIAVEMYRNDEVSLGRAAEIASTDRESFKEILEERGVDRILESREGSKERVEEVIEDDENTV
jgi:predicted HTH domain antitoxin